MRAAAKRALEGVKAVPRRGDLGPLCRLSSRRLGTQLADPAAQTRNRTAEEENLHMRKILPARRTLVALAATASVLAALVGAGAAPGDVVTPVVSLGPTTVANGVATVSGTVTAPAPSNAQLSINGQPVGLNADGTFAGIVNLNGQSTLSLAVRNPATGEASTTNVPLTTNLVGPGGVVSPTVLSDLEQAAGTITKPLGGFVSIGGQPISVSGGVGNGDGLASLSVNGIDALSLL